MLQPSGRVFAVSSLPSWTPLSSRTMALSTRVFEMRFIMTCIDIPSNFCRGLASPNYGANMGRHRQANHGRRDPDCAQPFFSDATCETRAYRHEELRPDNRTIL